MNKRVGHVRIWRDTQVDWLKKNATQPVEFLAVTLRRSEKSIIAKLYSLGLRPAK